MEAVINRKTGKKGKLLTRKLRGPKVGVSPDVSLLECKQGSGTSKAQPSKPCHCPHIITIILVKCPNPFQDKQ